MSEKYEKVIRTQEELIAGLEEQLEADQLFIDSQKQLIQAQQEKIILLEKEKQELVNAGKEMSATCEQLEKLCSEQQELQDSISKILEEK